MRHNPGIPNSSTRSSAQNKPITPFVISMFTHKGGVGKTTGTYNLAALLAKAGARVLIVDADSQCNLSKSILKYIVHHTDICPYFEDDDKTQIVRNLAQKNFFSLKNKN